MCCTMNKPSKIVCKNVVYAELNNKNKTLPGSSSMGKKDGDIRSLGFVKNCYYAGNSIGCLSLLHLPKKSIHYVQGQEPEPKVREYFYFIDHQGMLFLDDSRMKNFTSCFKDKKFLQFFFKRIRMNRSGRYEEDFPYLSLCGRERNFIRCDDRPIVYTHVIKNESGDDIKYNLSYAHAGDLLTTAFHPEKIYMPPESGRVYYPADEKVGGIGLIASKLAIEFSKRFEFLNGEHNSPTHFNFNDERNTLDLEWYDEAIKNQ